ncbi:MAG: sugar transferase [Coriobacteriia bacterium]|nr:sugar transferase [Coriobacteriia bacterium]
MANNNYINNNKNTDKKQILVFVFSLLILIVPTTSFLFTWFISYDHLNYFNKGNYVLVAVFFIVCLIFLLFLDGFKFDKRKFSDIIFSQFVSLFITYMIMYFIISLIAKKLADPFPLILSFIVSSIFYVITNIVLQNIFKKYFSGESAILVYGNDLAKNIEKKECSNLDRYIVRRSIKSDVPLDEIIKQIDKFNNVVVCDIDFNLRGKLIKYCYEQKKRLYIVPQISDIITRSADEIYVMDSPIFYYKNAGIDFTEKVIKRLFDIVFSIVGIVITSPFILLSAILIKLQDRGPIFYLQKRTTINNKDFNIIKFRSMIVDAESDGVARLTTENDNRITRVGKFLRLTRFDELPQFFNILKGDMSFVGPRPERPELIAEYEKVLPEFSYRTNVKAGLTGQAQVNAKYNTTPYDKLRQDLLYVANYNLFLDIKILFLTVKRVFEPSSTKGIDEGESNALNTINDVKQDS